MRRRQAYAQPVKLEEPKPRDTRAECPECGRKFRNEHGLNVHLARCKG